MSAVLPATPYVNMSRCNTQALIGIYNVFSALHYGAIFGPIGNAWIVTHMMTALIYSDTI